jgi:hypothetical protein
LYRSSSQAEACGYKQRRGAAAPTSDVGAVVLDKILRYEATVERQLYRAMNQLERLQRRRNGEQVPPPLTMDVSRRM